ncbi:Hsp20/alpha crystallin family protein [Planktothrix sp. FACHB-1355]|uniref:Hsp20/alpha crystallin family protein n=1 Tax=Aerosakkonema funiforme FACHB-1375 TaxID=2949571 RepID=A0A926VDZ4_9CYAN|nr:MULTISPECIES: Hsp20/alpha crystallin family protein [Oscillatoriales]MBD2182125.1 Hsp20/alpha crystallin family protein [Aerosakkonema funiforme FACHB-1375]MBD3563096.1 Hsp20/alpha crystallin family protein [Planktothrix sp. FACHB-1355]
MRIVRLQPFQEMETLRRQMDRMFDELAQYNGETSQGWVPAIELHDEENHLTLRAEIPGVEGKDLDIHVTREAVSLAGERRYEKQAEHKGFYHSEFRYGKFQRTVQLPVLIQNDKVQAEFKNGILTLTLPKAEELQRKVVKVNVVNS